MDNYAIFLCLNFRYTIINLLIALKIVITNSNKETLCNLTDKRDMQFTDQLLMNDIK